MSTPKNYTCMLDEVAKRILDLNKYVPEWEEKFASGNDTENQ